VRLIRVSRSEAMKLAGHILRVYEIKTAYRAVVENTKRSEHSENLDVGGKIILKWF
jgi:hypothetical protein